MLTVSMVSEVKGPAKTNSFNFSMKEQVIGIRDITRQHKHTGLILVFVKAFDKVPHRHVIYKLGYYKGIHPQFD